MKLLHMNKLLRCQSLLVMYLNQCSLGYGSNKSKLQQRLEIELVEEILQITPAKPNLIAIRSFSKYNYHMGKHFYRKIS